VRFLERAFAVLTLGCGVVWAVYVLALGSDAGLTVPVLLVLVWGGVGLLLLWGLYLGVHVLATRRSPQRRHVRWLLAGPALLLLCFAIVWTGAAFWVRFFISRPALDAYVRRASPESLGGSFKPGLRVGLFWLREAELLPGGTVRMITTQCMFDDCGVVYSPSGKPPRLGEDHYSSLGGAWWHWWRSW
jgi:hypothetical protein